MTDPMETAQRVLADQPFSKMLGTALTAFEPGSAELSLPSAPELQQQDGFVHGGVLGYLADCAISFAAGSILGPAILTSEYKVNFLRPARAARLVARGRAVSHSRHQAICTSEVWSVSEAGETLCAIALGTVVIPSKERMAQG